jgi:hypothetical protein
VRLATQQYDEAAMTFFLATMAQAQKLRPLVRLTPAPGALRRLILFQPCRVSASRKRIDCFGACDTPPHQVRFGYYGFPHMPYFPLPHDFKNVRLINNAQVSQSTCDFRSSLDEPLLKQSPCIPPSL